MVGHHYPSNQFVKMSLAVADDQCFGNELGNPRLLQPAEALRAVMKETIMDKECMTRRQAFGRLRLRRQRTPEAPREEQVSAIWTEMR